MRAIARSRWLGGRRVMFVVQTGRARRTRKYSIVMTFVLFIMGTFAGILTLHWDVVPKKK
jgi:hypothetical protein